MEAAEVAYPNRTVRVQPKPNCNGIEVVQIHTRPLHCNNIVDLEWTLVEEGDVEHLLRNLATKGQDNG